jgi:hypothetical protein
MMTPIATVAMRNRMTIKVTATARPIDMTAAANAAGTAILTLRLFQI